MAVDVIVVGASVAGSSLAGLLGRLGARVLLLDKASFPRSKPCGEGMLPHGVKALANMGALGPIAKLGREIHGLSYQIGNLRTQAAFGQDVGFGLGIERFNLDQALFHWAGEFQSVMVEENVAMEALLTRDSRVIGVQARSLHGAKISWEAPVTVFADGLHSIGRKLLDINVRWPQQKRFGTVGHLDRVAGMGNFVEVIMGNGFEIYLTPLPGKVGVAVLHGEELFHVFASADRDKKFLKFIRGVEVLQDRLAESNSVGAVRQWGPLSPKVEKNFGEGFILAGDAAGAVDPITGEGMSVALRMAARFCPIVFDAIAQNGAASALSGVKEIHDQEISVAAKLSDLLRVLSRYPWLARRVVKNLGRQPDLFEDLLRVATGILPYESFDWLKKIKLVL